MGLQPAPWRNTCLSWGEGVESTWSLGTRPASSLSLHCGCKVSGKGTASWDVPTSHAGSVPHDGWSRWSLCRRKSTYDVIQVGSF